MKHQVDFLELLQIDYEKYPVIAVVLSLIHISEPTRPY